MPGFSSSAGSARDGIGLADTPKMVAYYNEYDPFAAAWLQKLIAAGHIASGVVDTRSIEYVAPDDLKGFTQCHFFAGIGVWSYALRRAGWSDDRPVWTGSCPCQPFSAAGKGNGFADERHLWPAFFHLIEQCGPAVVLGEQVASKDGLAWLDLVRADVEGAGRAFGAADLCAAGFGAPHIRQRSFWVAYDGCTQWLRGTNTQRFDGNYASQRFEGTSDFRTRVGSDRLGNTSSPGPSQQRGGRNEPTRSATGNQSGGLADAPSQQAFKKQPRPSANERRGRPDRSSRCGLDDHNEWPSPTNGHWRDADWLGCRDGKWRPVEPGTFPLVNGATNRVGRLRGYGNAIVAQVAQGFIEAVMECLP